MTIDINHMIILHTVTHDLRIYLKLMLFAPFCANYQFTGMIDWTLQKNAALPHDSIRFTSFPTYLNIIYG